MKDEEKTKKQLIEEIKGIRKRNALLESENLRQRLSMQYLKYNMITLQMVIDNIPQYISWKDKSSVYMGCNANFAKMSGIEDARSIFGKTDYDLKFSRKDADANIKKDREIMETNEPEYHSVINMTTSEGKELTFDHNRIPLVGKNEETIGVISTYEDITERKRIEEDLQKSEELYRTLAETANDIIFILNRDGTICYANSYASGTLNLKPEDIIGKQRDILFPPQTIEIQDRYIKQLLETGEPIYSEEEMSFNGTMVWLGTNIAPIKDASGKITKVLGISRDITERKRGERALYLDEQRLEALLRLNEMTDLKLQEMADFAIDEGVRLTGSKHGFIMSLNNNDNGIELYSLSRSIKEKYLKMEEQLKITMNKEHIIEFLNNIRSPIVINSPEHLKGVNMQMPIGHPLAGRYLFIPIIEGDSTVALATVAEKDTDYDESDVRQLKLLMGGLWKTLVRKSSEKALSEAKAHAELYVDLMGHDINNMNFIAMGYLELALDTLNLDEDSKTMISTPLDMLKNSSTLIENVRKIQSIGSGEIKYQTIDIIKTIERVKEEYSKVADCKVFLKYPENIEAKVLANELIKDVFSNLVGNAIKHSVNSVTVNIELEKINIGDNSLYRISVEDNGPGINDELKKKIFDRLSRGKTNISGKGIGLYLVKTLVNNYNGKVWVEDRVPGDYSKGSRFVILLPCMEDQDKNNGLRDLNDWIPDIKKIDA